MKILAISGSQRRVSTNSALLRSICDQAPPSLQASLYAGLHDLPIFSPDLEGENTPFVGSSIR